MAKPTKQHPFPLPVTNVKTPAPNIFYWKRARLLGFCMIICLGWAALSNWQPRIHTPKPRPKRLNATEAENFFLTVPDAQSALGASRHYATHPHLAGSSEDFQDAKDILGIFQAKLGIRKPREEPIFRAGTPQSRHATLGVTAKFTLKRPTAWIDTYFPVLNTPLGRKLEILEDNGTIVWGADLEEDGDPLDEDAGKYRDSVPTWHGLSFDGSAAGQLVYANYGTQADYSELLSKGFDFTGKIILVRYGGIFRGLKIKGAQELGAAGVLIYSDPRDDGLVTVENGYKAYPHGPARNPTSVQRGSVQFLSLYPGDPTTPGYPAYEHAERQEAVNIPKIPSLPISWNNAQILLNELKDSGSNATLADVLQITGRSSKREVKLVNHVDNKVTPVWNTMASIPGHISDEVILIGCHRDAWVLGAADPTSGTVSLLEVVRGFGELLRKGWKPLRTIVIASWDAEEYGLVGSVEWGEDFEQWISNHVVAYVNVDVSVSGSRWAIYGSPSLAHIIKKTALDVPHPTVANKTLWDARDDTGPFKRENDTQINSRLARSYQEEEIKGNAYDTGIKPLGSGSDYTVFLQRIGVASTDQGLEMTSTDAVYHYHSIYDTQRWQETYADPTFERHVAIAKHLGLLTLRLVDSVIIPLNTTQYALELDDYLDRVAALASDDETNKFSALRSSIKRLQKASIALDEEKTEAEEKFKEILAKLPQKDHRCRRRRSAWRYLKNKLSAFFSLTIPDELRKRKFRGAAYSAEDLMGLASTIDDQDIDSWPFPIRKFIRAAKRVGRANKKLLRFERGFISEDGIRDREWYKHLGVAPGKWLGYGATTLPALTEAITEKQSDADIEHEVNRLVDLIDKLAEKIKP